MKSGEVDGQSIPVECPECDGTEFKIYVTHSYDGPYIDLRCVRSECGDGELTAVHISISQKLELM